jgi:hypothetical protein
MEIMLVSLVESLCQMMMGLIPSLEYMPLPETPTLVEPIHY